MTDLGAPGLPLWAQLPASLILLLLLALALHIARTTSGRFVVFACWLRFMLSSYHLYTFRHVVGDMSGTALGSAGLFVVGAALLPRSILFNKAMKGAYFVAAAIVLSGAMNRSLLNAFEPLTKLGLLVVLALHTYNALRTGEDKQFVRALLLSFAPLLVFQGLSLALDLPKSTEGTGGASYIGGYYHEAAFSIALIALLCTVAVSRGLKPLSKGLIFAIGMASIVLANYRTAILAAFPLIIYYLLKGIGAVFDRRLRGIVISLTGGGLIVASGLMLMNLDRFRDLQPVLEQPTSLIKAPDEFSRQDATLLSGRTQIWSQYLYKWKDANELNQLVGFGPESWQEYFELYAHNTLVDFLFEYGLIGLAAVIFLFGSGLMAAWKSVQHRWKLLAAHVSFITLNLATMPLWLIEGNIVYGLLWGYTLFYRTERRLVRARPNAQPVLRAVSA